MSSSGRYKEDIAPMGSASEKIYRLRPVTFRYKNPDEQGRKPVQYGLIAEEVAKIMPELVVYDAQGKPLTVAYQTITSLLLNELQKARRTEQEQSEELAQLRQELRDLKEQTRELAASVRTHERSTLVAQARER
jgi:hypothetical protein